MSEGMRTVRVSVYNKMEVRSPVGDHREVGMRKGKNRCYMNYDEREAVKNWWVESSWVCELGGTPFCEGCFPCIGLPAFVPVISLGCTGSKCCWILSPGGQEGEAWSLELELLVLLEGLLRRRKLHDPAVAS